MARPSHLSPDNILRFMQVRTDPASAQDISRALHLKKSDYRPLLKMLGKLKKRGAVREFPGGRYHLTGSKREKEPSETSQRRPESAAANSTSSPRRDELTGRLVLHHDGYGFVVPDIPTPQYAGDIFIPRDAIDDAMHGDHVLAKILRTGTGPGPQRAEGRIVRVLNRAHPSVVGLFRYGQCGNYVLPYDARMQHSVEIRPGDELTPQFAQKLGVPAPAPAAASERDRATPRHRPSRLPHIDELDGAVVNVEILKFPRGGASPTGRVIEILGRPGDLGVDIEIIIRKHHLPHVFPPEVIHEAESLAQPVTETDTQGREDFR